MAKLIQYMTKESLYDGAFDNSYWAAAGMGYVIVTENKKFIVIDGGHPNDSDSLIELLAKQGDQKNIEIEYWIITHPHLDHYGAVQKISETTDFPIHITVKQFVYWFPEEFLGHDGIPNALSSDNQMMEEICRSMNAKPYRPQRNDLLTVDDITIQFLYVPDDCSIINNSGGNSNFCSLIFTVKGKNKKAMITGDAYANTMQTTAWRYAKNLKCDILQMPHHALCDAYCIDFYRFVDPQILLMPISTAGYRAMHSKLYEKSEGCIANLCIEAKSEKVYKAFEGTAEIFI